MIKTDIDDGLNFGTWTDPVSRCLYHDSMQHFLRDITTDQFAKVGDFGGANGLIKKFIPQSISIDNDASKNPDICENILSHKGHYDLIVLRYVLHYLTDSEICDFFQNQKNHSGEIWFIQFANDGVDLKIKRSNSINEGQKFFRSSTELFSLINEHLEIIQIKSIGLNITREFYKNRLKNNNAQEHYESIYFIRGKIK
jgi:hypothetical protein